MAEPHDRCTLDGCTLGREHVGKHAGPLCPNCKSASRWLDHRCGWWCGNDDCDYLAAIPVPAEPARQPMPAAAPVAPAADTDATELDQYLIDLAAEATEHDENARHHQRLAKDARDRAAHLRAWRTKTSPSSTVVGSDRRGIQP